jgi:potassium-transporting ATPase KdpC subunit
MTHLRANLWLLVLTVLLCSVLYPLALWAIGQTIFPTQSQGSLILDAANKPIGSQLIAQEFKGDEYFQPRPSAASYKAEASGASNWGANNYLLRDRVARQLGPIVRYGKAAEEDGKVPGELVGPDIERWFQTQPDIVETWASQHSGLAEAWVKDTDTALKPQWKIGEQDREPGQSFLQQLAVDKPKLQMDLAAKLKDPTSAGIAELAKEFFPIFSKRFPGQWLTLDDFETKDKEKRKKLVGVKESSEIQSVFFDVWRQQHPTVALEEVPADMVTASASGLDPHITLKNAQYQLKYRVAAAQAKKIILDQAKKQTKDYDSLDDAGRQAALEKAQNFLETRLGKQPETRLMEVIEALLTKSASAPLGGLVGVPLINVLEMNLALDERIATLLARVK